MSAVDYARVVDLFQRALERPPSERSAFVESACDGDAGVRARVMDMLAFDEGAATDGGASGDDLADRASDAALRALRNVFTNAGDDGSAAAAGDWMPESIGPYRIVRRIGEGGMGTVFEARQDHPARTVALKTLRDGIGSTAMVRRFRREIGLLARLRHQGIARILDAGTAETDRGTVPWFTMEYIDGRPILDSARDLDLDVRARLELMAEVCDAVQDAHQRGVIHRDLKPANILVEIGEEGPRPIVLDFGVARATETEPGEVSLHTAAGGAIGTLPYMSPEQVGGERDDVDTRTDVYALGVVLYELLAGQPPLDVATKSLAEAARIIRDVEPRRLGMVDRALRGEVETIVAKALEKDRERRYASASELGSDLRRHLADEPIVARPATTLYQVRKFARRHRALVTVVAAAAAGLAIATGVSIRWALLADAARGAEAEATALARRGEAEMRWLSYRSGIVAATALAERDPAAARRELDLVPKEHRGWEWYSLTGRLGTPLVDVQGDAIAWDASGRPMVARVDGATVVITDHASGAVHARIDVGEAVGSVELGSRSRTLLVRVVGSPVPWLFDVATGERRLVGALRTGERIAAVDPAERAAVVEAGDRRSVRVVDIETGAELGRIDGADDSIVGVDFDGTGSVVHVRTATRSRAFRLDTGTPIGPWTPLPTHEGYPDFREASFAEGRAFRVEWSPAEDSIRVLDRTTGAERRTVVAHAGGVLRVVLGPDERTAASVGIGSTVHIWDIDRGVILGTLPRSRMSNLAFSPDGSRIIVDGDEATFAIWDWEARAASRQIGAHDRWVYALAISPDGRLVAAGGWDGFVRVHDIESGESLAALPVEGQHVGSVGFSRDGTRLFAAVKRGFNRVQRAYAWDTESWAPRPDPVGPSPLEAFIAAVGGDLSVARFNGGIYLAVGDGGRLRIDGEGAANLAIVERATGSVRTNLSQGAVLGGLHAASFAPDGRSLAIAGNDSIIHIRDTTTGATIRSIEPGTQRTYALAFTRDGRRLAAAGNDPRIRIFDVATGDLVATLDGHADYVQGLAFTPDGRRLVSGSGDGTVRVWDSASPEPDGPGS